MTYQPEPIVEEGGQKKVVEQDKNIEELLAEILVELKLIRMHMEQITCERINSNDIDGE